MDTALPAPTDTMVHAAAYVTTPATAAPQLSVLCAALTPGHADPALHDDWLAAVARVVAALGGQLEPLAATEAHQVHVVFGAGDGTTEHAERALQCGLALLAHAREAAAGPADAAADRATFGLRIGLHSGPAATGPTRHTHEGAARIALATPPGRIGLSVDSLAWLRGQCEVSAATPLPLPGAEVPLQRCVLLRATTRDSASAAPVLGGSEPAEIGDVRPAAALHQAFSALQTAPAAAAITLVAEAGVGKSHQLRAFLAWAWRQPHPLHLLRGQAHAYSEHEAFGLLSQMLRGHLKIDADDTLEAARDKLRQGIAPWFVHEHGDALAQDHAHVLGHLIGIDASDIPSVAGIVNDPRALRQRALHVAMHWLRKLSARGKAPLLMVVEDLHWADNATLEWLEQLLQANADTALLVVATSRPTLATRRPAWLKSHGLVRAIELGRLDDVASRQLAARLLSRLANVPAALINLVLGGADGHPLSIEQRVQLLIDQGVIHATLGRWRLDAARLRSARLPSTLRAVVQARLALLPAAARLALQTASVMGPTFPAQAQALALAQAAPADGSAQGPSFQHPLLQEWAYDSLPKLTRRAWHGRIAHWLVSMSAGQPAAALGQLAHHFERAGEALLAAEHHVRAAEHAASLHAHSETLHHVQQGLALLEALRTAQPASGHLQDLQDLQELSWRLLRLRNHALKTTGQHAQQAVALDALAALAEAMDDDGKRALAFASRSMYLLWRADYAGLKVVARQAMACAERAGAASIRIDAMRQLALAHCYLGDWDAGERLARQGLAQARELGLPKAEGPHLSVLAMVAQHRQEPLALLRWHEQELRNRRAIGDPINEVITLVNLGEAWLDLGDFFEGRRVAEEALRLTRATGDGNAECVALLNLCKLERWVGNGALALRLAREAVATAQRVGLVRWEAEALCRVGEVALELGELSTAAEAFATALAQSLARKANSQLDAAAGLARLALVQGDVAAAMRHVQRILDSESASGARHEAQDARHVDLVCHLVLSSAGDARASAWLQRAYSGLMASAATIDEPALRAGFLANIPDHRAILSAWALAQAGTVALAGDARVHPESHTAD